VRKPQPRLARRLDLPKVARQLELRPDDLEAMDRGWMPLASVSVLLGLGLVLVAVVYAGALAGADWAPALRWLALLMLFVPVALRQFSPSTSRQERLILIGMLAMALFTVKVLYSPLGYKFSDELQHWRTAQDILETHRLFAPNFILPVSPLYPGLEILTTAAVELTGLSIFQAGLAIMAVARLTLVLALFLLFERDARSARVAGVATLLYMAHPHFLFLNAMFTYQALALSFMALVLLAAARCAAGHSRTRVAWRIVFGLALLALAATHHITMYLTAGFLVLWLLAGFVVHSPRSQIWSQLTSAVLAVAAAVGWLLLVAPDTQDYLVNGLNAPLEGLAMILAGETEAAAQTFRPPGGPLIDKLISVAAIGAMLLGLGLGWWRVWQRRGAQNALAVALAIAAGGYLASLGLRLISDSGELTGRLWTFVFAPSALIWAAGMIQGKLPSPPRQAWINGAWTKWGLPALAIVIFLGGITSGWPPYWGRLPGPYLPGAAERSMNPEGVAAGHWIGTEFAPGNRIATDFPDYMIAGAYGHQYPVFGLSNVFTAPEFTETELEDLKHYQIRYLLVDRRLATGLPKQGYYFDPWEERPPEGVNWLDESKLLKFDHVPGISRVFDSGNVVIYDVGALSGVR